MSLNPLITNVNPTQSLYAAFGAGINTSQLNVSSIIVAPPNGSPDSGLIVFENVAPSTSGGVVFYKDAANQEPVLIGPALGQGVIGVQSATSSVFETLAVGELQIYGPARSTFGNAVRLTGDVSGNLTVSSAIYTHLVDADALSTTVLDIDGQALTATPTELLLNGVPLATTSNLSSIADWALDPAISTVQMNGNNLVGANAGFFSTITANSGVFNDISTFTFTAISTIHAISSISSSVLEAEQGAFSSLTAGFLSTSVLEGGQGTFSTLTAQVISTPALNVSSINGAEFTSTSITVQVLGVSSLVATSISSLTGGIREALVSTLQLNVNPQFNPSLSGSVNLGLGSLFGNLAGAASGVLGVVVGGAALGTGIAALTQTRQTNNINSNSFELVNGTTQLQISTLGSAFSTIYRFVSSVSENEPGQEVFVSTIYPPGVAIRSLSDPLNTVSSPLSTIQSFGQWVALDANLPIPSSISTFQQLFTSSLGATTPATRIDVQNNLTMATGTTLTVDTLQGNTVQVDAIGAFGLGFVDLFANVDNTGYFFSTSALFVSSINGGPPVVSSFNSASIGALSVTTVNGGTPYTTAFPPPTVVTSSFTSLFTQTLNASTISMTQGVIGGISSINGYPFSEILNPFEDPTPSFSSVTISTGGALAMTSGVISGVSSLNGLPVAVYTTGAIETISSLFTSTIFSLGGVSSLFITANSNTSISMPSNGDLDIVSRDIFIQSQGSTLVTFFQNADLNGGFGSWCNTFCGISFSQSTINLNASRVVASNISSQSVSIAGVTLSTSTAAGSASQPAGRLVIGGNDVDLGQNDLWAQQVRVGAGNPGGSAQTEVIWYSPDGVTQRGLGLGGSDLTLRIQSTINSGTNNGYILDTLINKPFFSTINGATNLMATIPSTSLGVLGVSTLSVIPPLNYFASVYSKIDQLVAGANLSTSAQWDTTTVNVGGFTIGTSTITVPVGGTYEIQASFQFDTISGGTNEAEFWLTKNGTAVDATNSIVSVVNNGRTLGNISIFDTAVTGDYYGWEFYSADNKMEAAFTAAGATPAIPSVIVNIKRLG